LPPHPLPPAHGVEEEEEGIKLPTSELAQHPGGSDDKAAGRAPAAVDPDPIPLAKLRTHCIEMTTDAPLVFFNKPYTESPATHSTSPPVRL
tara:strand:+ start:167 stop:439 length:273 start_codon:yes stop_codon:yes gene_type:complete